MNNEKQSSEVKTQIKTSKWNWFFGIIFIFAGIGAIDSNIIYGLLIIIVGSIMLPPVTKIIKEKYNLSISRDYKIIMVVLVLVTIIIIDVESDNKQFVNDSSNDTSLPISINKIDEKTKIVKTDNKIQKVVFSEEEKQEAQKELDKIMSLTQQAGLVISYEFSDKAKIVYVSKIWYTQTVSFKKDFLAGIAMLKEKTTGFKHFEVLDGYSNEKVAEVTPFLGSLEVYK